MELRWIVYILAGLGAGFATGFSGISAAAVISPMLVSFLNFDAYDAVGIALISDVLAAAESALSYERNGHLKVRDSLFLLGSMLVFTFIGSWASQYIPSPALGSISIIMSIAMGLKFLVIPNVGLGSLRGEQTQNERMLLTLFIGMAIGFVAGFAGAGGGMMTLFALTTIMDYDMKDAVGTSVFIMTFTALVGGVSHIYLGGLPNANALIVCTLSTLVSATVFSRLANRLKSATINLVTGLFLTLLGIAMAVSHFFF